MSSSYQMQQLTAKLKDSDLDVRLMALTDIGRRAGDGNSLSVDDSTETSLVETVLSLFNDSIAEVKSQAARTISILVAKVKEDRVQTIIERLTQMTSDKDDALRDVASLGLKTVVKEISPDSKLASTACNKLAPKILAQLKNTSSSQDLLIQLIEVLADVYTRFDQTIRSLPNAQTEGLAGLTPLLNDSRGAIRKRAIRALGALTACSGESLYVNLFDKELSPALSSPSNDEQSKTAIALAGTLALSAPKRTGKRIAQLVPPMLKAAESSDEELKETALQTLETLMLRCPAETTPYVSQIVEVATKLIKYDPNYAAGDDEMDSEDAEMNGVDSDGENGEDEDEFEEEEEYDDDDDVSWKVRRGSVKVLSTAIETRLEMLGTFYKSISPILISRFGEREETVRLEVWNTYTALLKQTGLSAGIVAPPPSSQGGTASAPSAMDDGSMANSRAQSPANSLKRKRDGDMETNDSPVAALRSQAPQVAKTIIKQLTNTKSVAIRLAGFHLLYQLILVLQGGLDSQTGPLFTVVETILKSADSGSSHGTSSASTTSLKIQVYAFLSLFFRTHSLRSVHPHLAKLTPLLVKSIENRSIPKIGAAAFGTASDLVKLVKPLSGLPASPMPNGDSSALQLRSIFDATVDCLSRSDIDQDIRERGLVCLGDLVIHAGTDFGSDITRALTILKDRLRNENTRLVSLMTLSRIAEAPGSKNPQFGGFLQESADEVVGFLRKTNKPVQAASFVCLEAILRRSGSELSATTSENIVKGLQPSIVTPDIHLARSLNSLSTLLEAKPDAVVQPVEKEILPYIYDLVSGHSATLTGPATASLLRLFGAYVSAGGNGPHAVGQLRDLATNAKGGVQTQMIASKCIGGIYRVVFENDPKAAEKIVKDANAKLKTTGKTDPSTLCLGFLTIGEIGRKTDMQKHEDVFKAALAGLIHSNEEVRSASAFAIGNMAAGSPATFLPSVLQEIQKASQDDRKMHLLLGSVKEILSHSAPSALSDLSKTLWDPLFQICERAQQQEQASKKDASTKAGDEARLDGTRNIAAECLGMITLTDPAEYLGKLQARLDSKSAGTRAAVITAVRFTFSDASSSYDDLLAPLMVPFLSLMSDSDLTVRRLAVTSLTSAAHNKPALVKEHLAALQPILYKETKIDPSLIHEVTMGPFKVKVDDGLNIRKAAFQCMYTLMETCLNKIDLNAFLDIIIAGLSDDDDVKVSCYLMLVKLGSIAPTAVVQRLDSAATPFDAILKMKLKETAVKQEVEKLSGVQRSALRTMAALLPLSSEATTPKFTQLVNDTKAGHLWGAEFKDIIANAADNQIAGADKMDID